MRSRTAAIACGLACVGLTLALLFAASWDYRRRAFSIDVPNAWVVARLHTGEQACQGPITAQASFDAVHAWSRPSHSLTITVRRAGDQVSMTRLASGTAVTGEISGVLVGRPIPLGRRFFVCIRDDDTHTLAIEGYYPNRVSGHLMIGGHASNKALALSFLRPNPRSLLAELPSVFSRAAQFKPTWAGPWIFWLLSAAIVATGGGLAFAVKRATAEDAFDDSAE